MASVQVEDGYTRIANALLQHLAGYRLSGQEWQVLLVIMQKTWGWHKKQDAIALTQFVDLTGMPKASIIRALHKLQAKNIISVYNKVNGKPREYSINKDFDTWQPATRKFAIYNKVNAIYNKVNAYTNNVRITQGLLWPVYNKVNACTVYNKVNAVYNKVNNRLQYCNPQKKQETITKDKNINTISREQNSKQQQKITFDTQKFCFIGITQLDVEKWVAAYACDVQQELKKMEAWLKANPSRRKKNYEAFIVKWLARAANTKHKGGYYGLTKRLTDDERRKLDNIKQASAGEW